MTSLYEIAAAYRADAEKLNDPELDLDDQTIADTLDGISGELEDKIKNIAMLVCNMEATATAIKEAEEKMERRRKSLEDRAWSLRDYMRSAMSLAGIEKIENEFFRVALRNCPESVDVFDIEAIPREYIKVSLKSEPDKKAIATKLKAGHDVPGARLEQKRRIAIF